MLSASPLFSFDSAFSNFYMNRFARCIGLRLQSLTHTPSEAIRKILNDAVLLVLIISDLPRLTNATAKANQKSDSCKKF